MLEDSLLGGKGFKARMRGKNNIKKVPNKLPKNITISNHLSLRSNQRNLFLFQVNLYNSLSIHEKLQATCKRI